MNTLFVFLRESSVLFVWLVSFFWTVLCYASSVVKIIFLVSEPPRRKIKRKLKWSSLVKRKAPRTNPGRKAAAKAEVVLKVTAVRVKAATTVAASRAAVRRSPTAAALMTTNQDDSVLIHVHVRVIT